MKKSMEIVKEEFKKALPDLEEAAAEKLVETLFQKVAPRLAVEAEEPALKMVGSGMVMIYGSLKPAIDHATDFNHDGK